MTERRKTKQVKVGKVLIGGEAPCVVQSMTKTDTRDLKATVAQIKKLEEAGCEIVRVAVPDMTAAKTLGLIKREIHLPLVADIHFDYRLALLAIREGVDKLRINPGNIGGREKVKEVVRAAKERGVPIRIGVNAGSIEKHLLAKYGSPTPEAAVESALSHIQILEELNFTEIVVSLKFSDVPRTIAAYKLMAQKRNYPLHLGITEAGTPFAGSIKSAVGLGILLNQGIGDTLRVSLTGEPVEEVKVAYEILKDLNLRNYGPVIISCPGCGRTEVDLLKLTKEVEKALKRIKKPLRVAVMGCVVNGPGEAAEADVALIGGKGQGLIMRQGKVVATLPEKDLIQALLSEIKKI